MLTASLLSTVVGLMLQKPGGIYVEQSLRFRRPVFIGDTLTATAEVTELLGPSGSYGCGRTSSTSTAKPCSKATASFKKTNADRLAERLDRARIVEGGAIHRRRDFG